MRYLSVTIGPLVRVQGGQLPAVAGVEGQLHSSDLFPAAVVRIAAESEPASFYTKHCPVNHIHFILT